MPIRVFFDWKHNRKALKDRIRKAYRQLSNDAAKDSGAQGFVVLEGSHGEAAQETVRDSFSLLPANCLGVVLLSDPGCVIPRPGLSDELTRIMGFAVCRNSGDPETHETLPVAFSNSSRQTPVPSAPGIQAAAASRRGKGLFHRLGVLCNDDKEGARRPLRLPVTLFPVLNRIQRETKLRGKLRLTQSHPGAQFSHVHLRRRHVGDSYTDWLALYPVACLLSASQQLVSERTVFCSLRPAGLFHYGFFSLQSDFRPRIRAPLRASSRSDRLVAGPAHAPPLLQGQVRHLHHQRGLKRQLHGSRRRLARAHAFQEVLHVQIGGPAEAFLRFLLDRDRKSTRLNSSH